MPRKRSTAKRQTRTESAPVSAPTGAFASVFDLDYSPARPGSTATASPLAGGFETMFGAPTPRDPMDPARPGSLKLSQWFGMKDCPHCEGIGRVPTTKEDFAPKPAA